MNEIEKEMNRVVKVKQNQAKEEAQNQNDAPCVVCGSKEFVQKFRNVIGEISGSMQGHFSLFGGSISGSIDSSTKTLPVLSCRKCENEREIATWDYVYEKDVFWDYMHNFYFGFYLSQPESFKSIDPFFLQRPIETREYMLKNPNWKYQFFNEIPKWSTETWATAAFKISKIKKKHFIFWTKEVYPTWESLTPHNHE